MPDRRPRASGGVPANARPSPPLDPTTGFETNLAGPWHASGGTWTDAAAGEQGTAGDDGFYLSSRTATDFACRAVWTGRCGRRSSSHLPLRCHRHQSLHRESQHLGSGEALAAGPTLGLYNTISLGTSTTPIIDVTDSTRTSGLLGLNVWNGSVTTQERQCQ